STISAACASWRNKNRRPPEVAIAIWEKLGPVWLTCLLGLPATATTSTTPFILIKSKSHNEQPVFYDLFGH
ncbi:MAG: hypothetical protein ACI4T7_08285, partial [Alloprevotella sp.]